MPSYKPAYLGSVTPTPATPTVCVSLRPNASAYVTIHIMNTGPDTDVLKVALKGGFEDIDPKHYICYDLPLVTNYLFVLADIGLRNQEQVVVESQLGTTTFTVYGADFLNP